MNGLELGQYRQEYESEGIGQDLYQLIVDVVNRVVFRYPPEVYSPNRVWDDDAIMGLCHDFTVDNLLRRGRLEYHLLTQETADGLRKALSGDFRRFLIGHRRRSEYLNLYKRVRGLLANDSRFQTRDVSLDNKGPWGLTGWKDKLTCQQLDEVTGAMFGVRLPPPVRYREESKKLSPILKTTDLGFLLENTFGVLNQWVLFDLLMNALRFRLGILEVVTISLDEPIVPELDDSIDFSEVVPDMSDPFSEPTAIGIAEDIFARLTDRQRRILALRLSSDAPVLEEIGRILGVSKSTVHNEERTIGEHIALTGLSETEAETALSHLSALCANAMRSEEEGR